MQSQLQKSRKTSNEFHVDWPQLDFSKIFLFFLLFKKEKNRRRYCLSFLIFLEKNHQNKISCAKSDLMKRRNQRQILVNYGVLWYKFTYCQKLHLMLRGYIFLLHYGFFFFHLHISCIRCFYSVALTQSEFQTNLKNFLFRCQFLKF